MNTVKLLTFPHKPNKSRAKHRKNKCLNKSIYSSVKPEPLGHITDLSISSELQNKQ